MQTLVLHTAETDLTENVHFDSLKGHLVAQQKILQLPELGVIKPSESH